MTLKVSLTEKVIAQAESYNGIQAGVARLEDVLQGHSYQAVPEGRGSTFTVNDGQAVAWLKTAKTVLVLGLHHPEEDLRLDFWEQGDTWGNRRLREISELMKQWLKEKYDITAQPLPYHVEKGGLFLKDAAVLSGLGIVGRNNLLLHPEWGPRIRLRSILLDRDLPPTERLEGFSPCESCQVFCQKTCPQNAFPQEVYRRPICRLQIVEDVKNKVLEGETGEDGKRNPVIKYCRACELSCPIGA